MEFADPQNNIEQAGIVEGMRVADLGAGSGFYTIAAAKKVGLEGMVYAVDIQKDLLATIKTKAEEEGLSNVETLWGDLDEPGGSKLQDNFVDVVIVSNVLFQAENKEAMLKEAHRILKPMGGILLFVEWSDSFGHMGPTPDAIIQEGQARTLLEGAGFNIATTISAGAHHYGFIAKK